MSEVNFKEEIKKGLNVDFMLLSKTSVCRKITSLLENNKIIICNGTDRNGKIGEKVKEIHFDFEKNTCYLVLNTTTYYLQDKYLYNIIYSISKDKYSLEEYDEYYEKIEIDK